MGIFRQSATTLASRLIIMFVNIPISMIIARVLGARGQGIYSAALTFPALWVGFGLLGLDAAHLYSLSRDRRTLGPVLGNSTVVFLALAAILLPSYLLLVGPLLGEKGAEFTPFLLLSSVVVPLILARNLFLSLLVGLDHLDTYNVLMVLSPVGLLLMVVTGLLVAHLGTSFVILAYEISLLLFLIPAFLWLRRRVRRERDLRIRPDSALLRQSLAYGLKGHAGIVMTNFTYRFDTFLVVRWLGAAALGYYSIAVLLAEKLSHITASVQFVLFPRISGSSREEADRITPLVCRNALLCVFGAGLVMFGIGRPLIRIFYGDAYLQALSAYRILLPGIVALTLSGVLSSDLSGRNRRVLPTVAMTIAFGVNLSLDILWVRSLGIVGAAWASTIAYSTQSLLMAVFFWRITGISPWRLVIPLREDFRLYRRLAQRMMGRLRRERGVPV